MRPASIFLLLLSILAFTNCGTDYNSSTKYPIEHKHDYDDGHGHAQAKEVNQIVKDTIPTAYDFILPDFTLEKNEDIYSSKNRGHWQQPRLVLSYFGDLDDKIVADIGAGPVGYFTFHFAEGTSAKKILALDIEQEALDFINTSKKNLRQESQERIETRLVLPNNAKLKEKEVDAILISNTLVYIKNKKSYLRSLRKSLKKGGRLIVVDHKMKKLPTFFPPKEERMPLYEVESLLNETGYEHLHSDDISLPYHYIVVCEY